MSQKFTTEQFIQKAIAVHGGKYDYSQADYKTSKAKIKIMCRVHGIFEQTPSHHVRGVGCPKCNYDKSSTRNRTSVETFIDRVKRIHGNKYDYSLVNYVNAHSFVKVICREHGEFEVIAGSLSVGSGCPGCGHKPYKKRDAIDTEKFIERSKIAHGEKYDYSLVDYKKSTLKVIIVCPTHGAFEQTPDHHMRGFGCRMCANNKIKLALSHTTFDFINDAITVHGDRYDYSLVRYTNSDSKVEIICKDHGIFKQTPAHHKKGDGCPKCCNEWNGRRIGTREFVEKAISVHGEKYDYSATEYVKSSDYVSIACPKHGSFVQNANSHIMGAGCPSCNLSKGELAISKILSDLGYSFKTQARFGNCKRKNTLPFDFQVFTDNGFNLIEFHGRQHYESISHFGGEKRLQAITERDSIKSDWAIENNIPLLVIHYKEFEVGKEHLQSMLVDFLGQGKPVKHRRPKPKQFKQLNLFNDL